jgi:hypothetical protein
MGHWARIDSNNIVQEVIVIKEAELDTGNWGDKANWIKTSYNTYNGKHYVPKDNQDWSEESADQSKALRFRFAGVNMKYDSTNDVFYYQQPFSSWTLNTTTWEWQAPITKPSLTRYQQETECKYYEWNETLYQSDNTQGWELKVDD